MKDRFKSILAVFLVRFLARMPFSVLRALAFFIAKILWLTNSQSRRVTEINLAICFPSKDTVERELLAWQSLLETCRTATEIPATLLNPGKQSLEKISTVSGKALVDDAIKSGHGVIIIAPHLGNWEYLGLHLADNFPLTNLYKPAKIAAIDTLVKEGRLSNGYQLMPTNKKGVMGLLKVLKKGEVTGILPDQIPEQDNSTVFAPFFNEPAASMTLVSNFIKRTGSIAIGGMAKRLEDGTFEVIYLPADEDIYSEDLRTSVTGLNKTIEKLVLQAPAQYQWEYKRFRKGPEGKRYIYHKNDN